VASRDIDAKEMDEALYEAFGKKKEEEVEKGDQY